MGEERKAKGVLAAVILWCVILGALAASYRYLIQPYFAGRLEHRTGSASRYQHTVTVDLDSFSGYSILRSEGLREALKAAKIQLEFHNDEADYKTRIQRLASGQAQMAVFTIDSLVATGAELREYPASIVLVIDETVGADAVVAYKEGVSSIQDLDDPGARFVLTPSSPSEFLARIVLAQFSLPNLPQKWWIDKDGAGAVYKEFCAADKTAKRAYVLWEPYVSMALARPGAHVLLSSGNLKGYIIDVLVAERAFLRQQPALVAEVVKDYLRAAYSINSRKDGMVDLVVEDARQSGDTLSPEQARQLVAGIRWKNTLENYAHFGLLPDAETGGLQHLEDIIGNITEVLIKTGVLDHDPIAGRASTLYYDALLRELVRSNFHPGRKLDLVQGIDTGAGDLGTVSADQALPALGEEQWRNLVAVGELRVQPIAFARGTARLNLQSQRELAALAKRLSTLPRYYVRVVGHSRAEGEVEANRLLALQRAQAAQKELVGSGLAPNRVLATAGEPEQNNGSAQSVSFVVGQPAY